jgi:hypothetical protein
MASGDEPVRHPGSPQEESELLDALAANPDVHPPVAFQGRRLAVEPVEIEGPPTSRQIVEERR